MSNGEEKLIQRVNVTRRFLDRQRNPPEYVDEVLPTETVQLRGPLKRGVVRAPAGTIAGSYRITGTYQANAPGTFSLRVTRLSVFTGSREARWYIRHSRTGTADVVYFPTPGQETRLGAPREPVYAFGPGTVIYGFMEAGSAYWHGQFLEALTS